MKSRLFLAVTATAFMLTASLQAADEGEIDLEGIKCIVAGDKDAKAGTEVEYKGAKVFFCCKGCPKKFAADTEKYASKANHQLVATEQAKQVKCPLTGKDLNPDTAVAINGVEVTFCCNGCKGKAEKAEGDAQIDLVFSDKAFEKGFEIEEEESE